MTRTDNGRRVLVLNGAPCSGKSTLARALQGAFDDIWLHVNLDAFPVILPPFPNGMPSGDALRRIVTGHNAAVAAIVEAGNNIVLELVARKNNPGASLVLTDLFDRLTIAEVIVVCLRCDKSTALRREAGRSTELAGLVDRDHGTIDEECRDLLLDSGAMSVEAEVAAVRKLVATNPTAGVECLRDRVRREARDAEWKSG